MFLLNGFKTACKRHLLAASMLQWPERSRLKSVKAY